MMHSRFVGVWVVWCLCVLRYMLHWLCSSVPLMYVQTTCDLYVYCTYSRYIGMCGTVHYTLMCVVHVSYSTECTP